MEKKIRTFETGATRNLDTNKLEYFGFISPIVLERFGQYMHEHRLQADGSLRDSDNWQKGISPAVYNQSLTRHFIDYWKVSRGFVAINPDNGKPFTDEELLCAILFNTMGLLHEKIKSR